MIISLSEGVSCSDNCATVWYIKLFSAGSFSRSLVFPHFTPSFSFPSTLNRTCNFRVLYSGGLFPEAMLDSVATISTFTSENNMFNQWLTTATTTAENNNLIARCLWGSHYYAILRCGVPNSQRRISNLRSQQKREHKLNGKSFIL